MTTLRRVCLLAATMWVGLHLFLAAAYAGDHRSLPVLVVAMIGAMAATAVALHPLLASATSASPRRFETWSLTAAPAAMALLVSPFLDDGITGYANWPMGGMCVVIAALVIRRRRLPAALSALGIVAVNTWWVIAAGAGPASALFLAVPPVLWLVAAIGVDSVLRHSARAAEDYRRRAAESLSAMHLARAITEAEQYRIAELEDAALPLLRRVAVGTKLDADLARQADDLSRLLRDDLRARSLMTGDVRRAVSSARARGVSVVLSAETNHGAEEPEHLARQILLPLLADLPARSSISFRMTQNPVAVTVAVAPADAAIVSHLRDRAAPPGWTAHMVDAVEGCVVRFTVPTCGD